MERTDPLDLGHKVGVGVCGGGGDEAGVEGCAHRQGVLHQTHPLQQTEAMGLSVAAATQLGRQFDLRLLELVISFIQLSGSRAATTSGDRGV